MIASLLQTVEQKDDSAPRKAPQPNERMDQVKRSLAGISVTGEYDPAHCLIKQLIYWNTTPSNTLSQQFFCADQQKCLERAKASDWL